MIWKTSPLVKSESLVVFVNTLTADDKYPFRDFEKLPFHIQTILSRKQKNFSELFLPFLEYSANFK